MFTAHRIARFTTYGDKKLKPLADCLKELKLGNQPKRKQSRDEMLAALRAIRETLGPGEKPHPA